MGCALFDADGDGDVDLYVASGGNAFKRDEMYQDRLYFNDGSGLFERASDLLPSIHSNSSCVIPGDYDGDGDIDVFIGGLVDQGRYPYPGQSVLLKNEGGKFIDVTSQMSPDLSLAGMVTDACWANVVGDEKEDLILVGEWMSPTVFENQGSSFEKRDTWLPTAQQLTGWWMSIEKPILMPMEYPILY